MTPVKPSFHPFHKVMPAARAPDLKLVTTGLECALLVLIYIDTYMYNEGVYNSNESDFSYLYGSYK